MRGAIRRKTEKRQQDEVLKTEGFSAFVDLSTINAAGFERHIRKDLAVIVGGIAGRELMKCPI